MPSIEHQIVRVDKVDVPGAAEGIRLIQSEYRPVRVVKLKSDFHPRPINNLIAAFDRLDKIAPSGRNELFRIYVDQKHSVLLL